MERNMNKLFVYGTLMDDLIFNSVTGHTPERKQAVLDGYIKEGLNIREDESEFVVGHLLEIPSDDIWKALDYYEGSAYKKIEVTVRTKDGDVRALAYQIPTWGCSI